MDKQKIAQLAGLNDEKTIEAALALKRAQSARDLAQNQPNNKDYEANARDLADALAGLFITEEGYEKTMDGNCGQHTADTSEWTKKFIKTGKLPK